MPIRPALVLFAGLSGAKKSQTLEKVMRSCEFEQRSKHAGVHAIVGVTSPQDNRLHWREVDTHSCYSFCLQSAVHYTSFLKGEFARFTSSYDAPESIFADECLDSALLSIYKDMKDMKYFHKNPKYWRKALPQGLTLIKIWDVSFVSGVRHCLSMLTGYYDRSLPCLFIDLQRDVDNLHKPPERTEELEVLPDAAVLMRRRSRLQYFLRFAALGKSVKKSRRKPCLVVAVHDGTMVSAEVQDKVAKLKKAIISEAKELEIDQLINEDIFLLNCNDEAQIEALKDRIDESLKKVAFIPTFPLSWLFLRVALERTREMFIEKSRLEVMAKKCHIDHGTLEKMLMVFNSFGSLVYLPKVQPLGKHIILQPVKFAFMLSRLFDSEAKTYGIITQKLAKEKLGPDANIFLDILSFARLASPMKAEEIICEGKVLSTMAEICHYMPSIKTTFHENQCDKSALHLVVNHDIAPINRHVTLVSFIRERLHAGNFQTYLVGE